MMMSINDIPDMPVLSADELQHIVNHPIGKPGVEYDIVTVLLDLAAQENCDGEPYDQMQQAGEYIRSIRTQLAERDAEIEKLRQLLQFAACPANCNGNHPCQFCHERSELLPPEPKK